MVVEPEYSRTPVRVNLQRSAKPVTGARDVGLTIFAEVANRFAGVYRI